MIRPNLTPRLLVACLAAALSLQGCTQVQGVRRPPTVTTSTGPVPQPRPEPAQEAPPADEPVTPRVSTDPVAGRPRASAPDGGEVRGVWVVRTTLTNPEAVREMVRETHEAGFNTLLVQVRGRADAFYRSTYEPPSPSLAGAPADFDPLALVVEEAHARGMAVHAWVVAQLVWGIGPLPEDPAHLVNLHPDWLAVPRDLAEELHGVDPFDPSYRRRIHAWAVARDGRVEGIFASPSHPEARERLAAVVDDLVWRYPLDGIHLDYIRYPSPEFDYSRRALADFRRWALGRIPPGRMASLDARAEEGDVTVWTRENPELWNEWREEQVTASLQAVRAVVQAAPGRPILTAAVFADPVDARRGRFQDWPGWLSGGWVDAVAPMAYTPDDERFADLMEAARRADEAAGGGRVWAGVGIYQTDLEGALRKVGLARSAGAAGFVLFSYDWAVTEGRSVADGSYLDALARRAFPGRTPRR